MVERISTLTGCSLSMQDSAGRLSEVLNEQASRVQELRQQLSSGSGSKPEAAPDLALEVQALQEELRLALMREKENEEERRSQAGRLDALSRSLTVKEEMVRVRHPPPHSSAAASAVCLCSAGWFL